MVNSAQRYAVLEDEPACRLPICFLVDRSFSMNVVKGGERTGETVRKDGKTYEKVRNGQNPRIKSLNDAITGYIADIQSDARAKASVEMSVVGFGEKTSLVRDFLPIDDSLKNIDIDANENKTNLGSALKTGLELLDRRKKDYNDYGIHYFQPQLVILTDGEATDINECNLVAKEIQDRMNSNKLVCLPFLIGTDEGKAILSKFGPGGEVFRVESVNLLALFRYLSQSHKQASHSSGMERTVAETVAELKRGIKSISDI